MLNKPNNNIKDAYKQQTFNDFFFIIKQHDVMNTHIGGRLRHLQTT